MAGVSNRFGTFDLSRGPDFSRADALQAEAQQQQAEAQRIQADYASRLGAVQQNIDTLTSRQNDATQIGNQFASSVGNQRVLSAGQGRSYSVAQNFSSMAQNEASFYSRLQNEGQALIDARIQSANELSSKSNAERQNQITGYNSAVDFFNQIPKSSSSSPSNFQSSLTDNRAEVIADLEKQGYTPIASLVGNRILAVGPGSSSLPKATSPPPGPSASFQNGAQSAAEAAAAAAKEDAQRYQFTRLKPGESLVSGAPRFFSETFAQPIIQDTQLLSREAGSILSEKRYLKNPLTGETTNIVVTNPFGPSLLSPFTPNYEAIAKASLPIGSNFKQAKLQNVGRALGQGIGAAAGIATAPISFGTSVTRKAAFESLQLLPGAKTELGGTVSRIVAEGVGVLGGFGGATYYTTATLTPARVVRPNLTFGQSEPKTIFPQDNPQLGRIQIFGREAGPGTSQYLIESQPSFTQQFVYGRQPRAFEFQGVNTIRPIGGVPEINPDQPTSILQESTSRGTLAQIRGPTTKFNQPIRPISVSNRELEILTYAPNTSATSSIRPGLIETRLNLMTSGERSFGNQPLGVFDIQKGKLVIPETQTRFFKNVNDTRAFSIAQGEQEVFLQPIDVFGTGGQKPNINVLERTFGTNRIESIFGTGFRANTRLPAVTPKPLDIGAQQPTFGASIGRGPSFGSGVGSSSINLVENSSGGGGLAQVLRSEAAAFRTPPIPRGQSLDTLSSSLSAQIFRAPSSAGAGLVAITQSRLTQNIRPINETQTVSRQGMQTVTIPRTLSIPRSTTAQVTIFRPGVVPPTEKAIFRPAVITIPRVTVESIIRQVETPRITSIVRTGEIPRLAQIPRDTLNPPAFPKGAQPRGKGSPFLLPPIPALDFQGNRRRQGFGAGGGSAQGFDVFVKTSGKFSKVNKTRSFSADDALHIGEKIADNSTARSFVVRKSVKPIKRVLQPLADLGFKFASPKNSKKFPTGTYTEKNPYLIDTQGEKRGLSAARVIKNLGSTLIPFRMRRK